MQLSNGNRWTVKSWYIFNFIRPKTNTIQKERISGNIRIDEACILNERRNKKGRKEGRKKKQGKANNSFSLENYDSSLLQYIFKQDADKIRIFYCIQRKIIYSHLSSISFKTTNVIVKYTLFGLLYLTLISFVRHSHRPHQVNLFATPGSNGWNNAIWCQEGLLGLPLSQHHVEGSSPTKIENWGIAWKFTAT